jgi:Putative peptidoglycan binding domain/Domain of unknown function (DUF1906)
MTETVVTDYSFDRPDPSVLKEDGYVGVIRYLSPGSNPKNITAPEVEALAAVGLSITLVFESTNQRATASGREGGVYDAGVANAEADALGVPDNITIYYVMEDPTPVPAADWVTIDAYAQGCHSGKRPVGGYGSQALIEHQLAAGLISKGWQVEGWSHSVSPACHLFQRLAPVHPNPGGIDEDVCLKSDWGQWGGAPVAPTPQPVPTPVDLGPGSTGLAVTGLQRDLDRLGYAVAIDGIFGPATEAAVKAFQARAGIAADGVVGPQTQAALTKALAAPPNPVTPAPPFPGRLLRLAQPMMHGADVATWQAQMLKRGWRAIGAADGYYGPHSRDVCVAFQTEKRLPVDGIVGPVTWAASWTSPIT